MGRRAHVLPQLGVFRLPELLQRMQPPPVAVFADQPVALRVLPKPLHARGQNDQLSAVGHGHARAVDGLVAQPGAPELGRIEIHHALFQAVRNEVDVLLPGELHRPGQTLPPLAQEQAVGADLPAGSGGHREGKEDRTVLQKVFHPVVEEPADRRVVPAHHALHAADRADHVAFVDHLAAAHAHEEVFRVVGHADDLVGHHLSRSDDEVVAPVHDAAVDLRADGLGPEAPGDLTDEVRRDLAQLDHVVTPVVHEEALVRNVPEHGVELAVRHGLVGAESGQDIHLGAPLGEGVEVHVRDEARAGVEAGKVRRQNQGLADNAAFERAKKGLPDLVPAQALFGFGDQIAFHAQTPE